jgi:hypothetical protein
MFRPNWPSSGVQVAVVKDSAARITKITRDTYNSRGARRSEVGSGTMLQAGRSPIRVPDEVDFSIYLILPAALRPWDRLSL